MADPYPSRCGSEAAVLPRVDPVVHGTWHEGAPLTQDQLRQFERDGYLVLGDLFTAEEVAELRRASAALLANPEALDPATLIAEPNSREVRSVFMIHRQDRAMARLASDRRLTAIARLVLGDEIYVHQSRLNYKPGFAGREFYWHSDFETWHVEDGMPRMRALSMSILLSPNNATNGPLMIIPGSHLAFHACAGETPHDNYRESLRKQDLGVPDRATLTDLAAEHGIRTATGEPGTVILFDCNAMHGSNGNITPFPRSNAFIVYNAVSNRLGPPSGDLEPRPEFIAARKAAPVIPGRPPLPLEIATIC